MKMLKPLKKAVLQVAERFGLDALILNSSWRRRRLLILAYHGISLDDEHICDPSLYMEATVLRRRFDYLREAGCHVLALGEAVRRLHDGSLPPRAVVITFDDGFYDFYRLAFPLLQEFGYPATVYFTTYYSEFNRPVFDPMIEYLLWKGRGRHVTFPSVWNEPLELDEKGRSDAAHRLREFAGRDGLSGQAKDELLHSLADQVGVDYEALCRRRILHLMTPAEASQVAAAGIGLELHTHRHRVSRDRDRFLREIEENRRRIRALSGVEPSHFCYPGGFLHPEFPAWLAESGVRSATTCKLGICTSQCSPLLLPRLVDDGGVTMNEFGAWVAGVRALFPRRAYRAADGQLLEGE